MKRDAERLLTRRPSRPSRKPLVLGSARQVGKTNLVEQQGASTSNRCAQWTSNGNAPWGGCAQPGSMECSARMKRRLLATAVTVGAAAAMASVSLGQVSSVTRPTLQGGVLWTIRPALSPALVAPPAPAAPPTPAPPPIVLYVAPPKPPAPKSPAEQAAELKRLVAFQQRCAEEGLPSYQYTLGLRYLAGDGVAKDESQALQWLGLAARQGHAAAKAKLAELAGPNSAAAAPPPTAPENKKRAASAEAARPN